MSIYPKRVIIGENLIIHLRFNNIGKNLSKGETDEHFMLVNPNDAKLGDILCYDGHVEFYAGSLTESGYSYVYNCGSTSAIRSKTLVTKAANRKLSQTTYILRLRSDLKSGLAPSIQL